MTALEGLVLLLGCKVTLILGIVAALPVLTGRRWPHGCALGRRFGVLALLALPVAVWALPTLEIPVLSGRGPDAVETGVSQSGPLATPLPDDLPAAWLNRAAVSSKKSIMRDNSPSEILGLCVAATYGLVVLVLAIRFICAWRGLEQLKRASKLVSDANWQATLVYWSKVLGVDRPVELRMSDSVSGPMTFGWRVPVILVARDGISSCDQTQRDAIVIHELTHIAHGDFFWQALTRLAGTLYWIHPLMWLIRRQDRTLCERICDALCSQHLGRESYAQALVRIAGRKILRPSAVLGMAMANPSSMRRRLSDLETCDPSRFMLPNRAQRRILGGTVAIVLGSIVVGALTAQTSARGMRDDVPPTSETKTPPTAPSKKPNSQNNSAKTAGAAAVRLPDTINGQVLDQHGKPLANANVIVRIQRFNPYVDPTDAAAPKRWTASTDVQGRYTISTGATSMGPDDELRIQIRADGFADVSTIDYQQQAAKGSLPVERLHAGRKLSGRLVDPQGNPVTEAVIRLQANTSQMDLCWDSGPLSVDRQGAFSVSIPLEGKAAVAIYPRGFAPQIVDVPDAGSDMGPIRVESGTSLIGRIVDKQGQAVAGTVVATQSEEYRELFGYVIRIATAVKTDENGSFRVPPLRGTYKVWVTDGAPDYSRQLFMTGAKPPPTRERKMDFNGKDTTQEIVFRESQAPEKGLKNR